MGAQFDKSTACKKRSEVMIFVPLLTISRAFAIFEAVVAVAKISSSLKPNPYRHI